MTVNYYGQKLKSNGVPMVAWGLWSFAGILVNLGLRASEVRKLMSEPDPFEAMNKKFWKLRGHLLFKEDLDKSSIMFMKENWPKGEYLKWEKRNKDKFPKKYFSDNYDAVGELENGVLENGKTTN
tara:strand:+ start:385 stop:759 length:375 start_codon:yes stop_codon:yes gene_type:complete